MKFLSRRRSKIGPEKGSQKVSENSAQRSQNGSQNPPKIRLRGHPKGGKRNFKAKTVPKWVLGASQGPKIAQN